MRFQSKSKKGKGKAKAQVASPSPSVHGSDEDEGEYQEDSDAQGDADTEVEDDPKAGESVATKPVRTGLRHSTRRVASSSPEPDSNVVDDYYEDQEMLGGHDVPPTESPLPALLLPSVSNVARPLPSTPVRTSGALPSLTNEARPASSPKTGGDVPSSPSPHPAVSQTIDFQSVSTASKLSAPHRPKPAKSRAAAKDRTPQPALPSSADRDIQMNVEQDAPMGAKSDARVELPTGDRSNAVAPDGERDPRNLVLINAGDSHTDVDDIRFLMDIYTVVRDGKIPFSTPDACQTPPPTPAILVDRIRRKAPMLYTKLASAGITTDERLQLLAYVPGDIADVVLVQDLGLNPWHKTVFLLGVIAYYCPGRLQYERNVLRMDALTAWPKEKKETAPHRRALQMCSSKVMRRFAPNLEAVQCQTIEDLKMLIMLPEQLQFQLLMSPAVGMTGLEVRVFLVAVARMLEEDADSSSD